MLCDFVWRKSSHVGNAHKRYISLVAFGLPELRIAADVQAELAATYADNQARLDDLFGAESSAERIAAARAVNEAQARLAALAEGEKVAAQLEQLQAGFYSDMGRLVLRASGIDGPDEFYKPQLSPLAQQSPNGIVQGY